MELFNGLMGGNILENIKMTSKINKIYIYIIELLKKTWIWYI
jgi:hypothetical protein